MAHLAIKGHAHRGKEVIEILEMLGGKNQFHFRGDEHEWFVLNGNIQYTNILFDEKSFTLEEFLEKFPYKVGDSVSSKYLKNYKIEKAEWVSSSNRVIYKLQGVGWHSVEDLQPYKEAPMYLNAKANKKVEEIAKILESAKKIMEEIKLDIPEGYEFFGIDDDNKIVLTKKQPQYPKTYEECCAVISLGEDGKLYTKGYKASLVQDFQKLLICRDAYWKIAGEQMGLDEPWKPDWLNTKQDKFVLYTHDNVICLNRFVLGHNVLAFPTAEMRDAFYENFKELIELCKEFL